MLADTFSRHIDYLRISVTSQCNLHCVYCRPSAAPCALPADGTLTTDQILAVVRVAVRLGIHKVRLTGGEPLLRRDIVGLVRGIAALPGIDDLSLTTNALRLEAMASDLAQAGLKRVNVSLDSLQPERFARITGVRALDEVWRGIDAAKRAGLQPVKVNVVVMRGINDDEIEDFAALARNGGWHIRFIEIMPIGETGARDLLVTAAEMRERLPGLERVAKDSGGPAEVYHWQGSQGTVSFISPISQCFCDGCNRLRLTADGRLRPCLLSDDEVDLRPALLDGARPEALEQLIRQAVTGKPRSHRLAEGIAPSGRSMAQIGG